MKNVYIFLIVFLGLSLKSHGQGVDVIIFLDNSNSIDATEFSTMETSVQDLIPQILSCNGSNRVSVVHYGAKYDNGFLVSRIFIEADFSSNLLVANTFSRRTSIIGGADMAQESLGLIGLALDNVNHTHISSAQKTLNRSPTNSLIIFLFTDAYRNHGDSYLVNSNSTGANSAGAFLNYTNFKNDRLATFMVAHIAPDNVSRNAGAAIASLGGSYVGPVELYPGIDSPGGRYYYQQLFDEDFDLSSKIETITEDLCSQAELLPCIMDLELTTAYNVYTSESNQQATSTVTALNVISNGASANYHAGETVVLKPGFHGMNGSKFRGYIEDCSGNFEGRMAGSFENQYSDVSPEFESEESKVLSLSPNPANSFVTITSTKAIQNLTITSLDSKLMFNANIGGKDSYNLDVSNYTPGYYSVTITTDTGEVFTEKLIKN